MFSGDSEPAHRSFGFPLRHPLRSFFSIPPLRFLSIIRLLAHPPAPFLLELSEISFDGEEERSQTKNRAKKKGCHSADADGSRSIIIQLSAHTHSLSLVCFETAVSPIQPTELPCLTPPPPPTSLVARAPASLSWVSGKKRSKLIAVGMIRVARSVQVTSYCSEVGTICEIAELVPPRPRCRSHQNFTLCIPMGINGFLGHPLPPLVPLPRSLPRAGLTKVGRESFS